MKESQKYVLMVEMTEDVHVASVNRTVKVTCALTYPIPFSGDQKTAARARGAQKSLMSEVPPVDRLAGLVPVVADWHTKVKLLDVSHVYKLLQIF